MNTKSDIRIALDKMLKALNLHMYKIPFNRQIPYVCEQKGLMVRKFKDSRNYQFTIHVPCVSSVNFPMGIGNWTIFKDDDYATFKLFTELVEKFKLICTQNNCHIEDEVSNPFFGCKSIEEVIIKCDLL